VEKTVPTRKAENPAAIQPSNFFPAGNILYGRAVFVLAVGFGSRGRVDVNVVLQT